MVMLACLFHSLAVDFIPSKGRSIYTVTIVMPFPCFSIPFLLSKSGILLDISFFVNPYC